MAYVRGIDLGTSITAAQRELSSGRAPKLVMVGLLVGALIPLAITVQGEDSRAYGDRGSDTAPESVGPPPDAAALPGSGISADPTDTGSSADSGAGEDPAKVAQTTAVPEATATADPPAPVGSGAQRERGPTPPSSADSSRAQGQPPGGSPPVDPLSVNPPLARPPLGTPPGSPPVGQLFEIPPSAGQSLLGSPSIREVPHPGLAIRPDIHPPHPASLPPDP